VTRFSFVEFTRPPVGAGSAARAQYIYSRLAGLSVTGQITPCKDTPQPAAVSAHIYYMTELQVVVNLIQDATNIFAIWAPALWPTKTICIGEINFQWDNWR